MKMEGTNVEVLNNAEIFLQDVPVDEIRHPAMDPQDPYKPFHTGFFQEEINLNGNKHGLCSYIPGNFAPSGPQIMLFPDSGCTDPKQWIQDAQWDAVAEEYGCMLCVLPAPMDRWGRDAAAERKFAEGVFLTTIDRCLYNSNESVFYIVGYGAGNQAALAMALLHCDQIAGVVAFEPDQGCEELLKELETASVGAGETVPCKQVAVHAWVIQKDGVNAKGLLDYLKTAARVAPEPLRNPVGDVFLADPSQHFAAINQYPVAQVWVSCEQDIRSLSPFELHEQMWKFLRKVKRWRGAIEGSLRPTKTMEQMRLIRHEKEFDGYRRYWHLFVPSRFYAHPEEEYPLVVCTHGYSCSSEIWSENSDWHIVGEARNFFVLYMTALPHPFCGNWVPLPLWNACYWKKQAYPDDVRYILGAIQETCKEYPINAKRIYSAGHSNGGAMCQELMFRCPEVFAAFSPAGYTVGDLCEELPQLSEIKRPVMLHKAEFDVFSAADTSEDAPNMKLMKHLCAVNQADFQTAHVRENGQYRHITYLTEQNVPMVQLVLARNMIHTYTPELAWMTWDTFFAHFERNEDGSVQYLY